MREIPKEVQQCPSHVGPCNIHEEFGDRQAGFVAKSGWVNVRASEDHVRRNGHFRGCVQFRPSSHPRGSLLLMSARLIALAKEDGGVRGVATGSSKAVGREDIGQAIRGRV